MKPIILLVLAFALTIPAVAQVEQGPQGPVGQGRKRGQRGGKVFKKMDKNNGHQISRDEWRRQPKAFDRLDQNHDGSLTGVELKAARRPRRDGPNP